MNENLNLAEILKDCPSGTKLYSPVYGDVELEKVIQVEDDFLSSIENDIYPIKIKLNNNSLDNFTKDGRMFVDYSGECMLFPSKDQRDWSKFKSKNTKQPKFNPKTFQPFDKVLVRRGSENYDVWFPDFVSDPPDDTTNKTLCMCIMEDMDMVIPYNEDTKHLNGTSDEAPEYYRYWED